MMMFKELAKTAGWRVLQSWDGMATFSSSGDVLVNTNIGSNNSGNPNFYLTSANTGVNLQSGSLSNYNSGFILAPPAGVPSNLYFEISFQISNIVEGSLNSNYLGVRTRFSRAGFFPVTNALIPPSDMSGVETVLFGDGTNIAPSNSVWWVNGVLFTGVINMGVSDDATNPFFWLGINTQNTNDSRIFGFVDCLTQLVSTGSYGAVCGWFGGAGQGSQIAGISTLSTNFVNSVSTSTGKMATSYTSGTVQLINMSDLKNSTGTLIRQIPATGTIPLDVIYSYSALNPQINGIKGISRNFYLTSADNDQSDAGMLNGEYKYVLHGDVYLPVNSGSTASGGTNGSYIIR